MTWVMVAVGGAAGSLARYGVAFSISRWVGNPVPIATALVNVVGCAVAGILLGLTASQRLLLTAEQRALLVSGVLGGLTTFSGFGIDTLVLVQEGRGATAVINIVAQVIVGLAVLALAFAVARR
jgi:CrcB protein